MVISALARSHSTNIFCTPARFYLSPPLASPPFLAACHADVMHSLPAAASVGLHPLPCCIPPLSSTLHATAAASDRETPAQAPRSSTGNQQPCTATCSSSSSSPSPSTASSSPPPPSPTHLPVPCAHLPILRASAYAVGPTLLSSHPTVHGPPWAHAYHPQPRQQQPPRSAGRSGDSAPSITTAAASSSESATSATACGGAANSGSGNSSSSSSSSAVGGGRCSECRCPCTCAWQWAGAPAYMAPEQWGAALHGPLSPRADSWAFACTALEMMTGGGEGGRGGRDAAMKHRKRLL